MYYAGIGSRGTPEHVLRAMKGVANYLATQGLILRSGGADGADTAFEQGCDEAKGRKEIFLPWKGFNGSTSTYYRIGTEARRVASLYHPRWEQLKDPVRNLMGRNTYQILGKNHDEHAAFLLCWTSKGKFTGGTGQSLRLAKEYKIPIFNLGAETTVQLQAKIIDIIQKHKQGRA